LILHSSKSCNEVAGVFYFVDGGSFDTESGDGEGNLAVGVALVGLSKHLVDVAGDVGGYSLESCGVVEHDRVGGWSGRVLGA